MKKSGPGARNRALPVVQFFNTGLNCLIRRLSWQLGPSYQSGACAIERPAIGPTVSPRVDADRFRVAFRPADLWSGWP
jgi:hypothetical protein